MAEEGLRIAETVNNPFSLILAYYGLSVVYLRQGDVHRAIPVLERGMGLCQDWHIPLFVPRQAAALGVAYALDGRIAAGLALVEQGVEQAAARGRLGRLAPLVAWLSEAYLLAGRLEDAQTRAAQASISPASTSNVATSLGVWLLGESTARQPSPEVGPAAATTAGPRPGRGAGHAPAPGALSPRPRDTVRQARSAGTGACRPGHRHRPVPHGDDLLASASGGGAGAVG